MNKIALIRKIILSVILPLVLFIPKNSISQEKEKLAPPETIADLKVAIEKVLEETKTPAAGIAIVNNEGPVWIAGLGKANIEKNVDANENTMFRIGSVSKMFVSLSVLKLKEEGRLNLNDKVRDLVPEIEFENQWEDTNPILVEHLLEHTTGWDDFHLTEYAHNDSTPASLKDGLDYHPHSRISRWIPGTRMAYCNSGPPVAAYIVEKITGQPFEEYVRLNFFQPMGMENMTYFASEVYKQLGATLYINGKPQDYWYIIMRPSGSINASPKDMAKMVRFFINRGMVDSLRLISEASLNRMETPSTTTGAKAGLEAGYGLNNYSSRHKSFVYRSHNGGVNGGLTDFSYLPEFNVGYAIMINSGDVGAFTKITKLVRDFQTKDFEVKKISPDSELTKEYAAVSGYYIPINPRNQMFYFLEPITGIQRIWCNEDSIFIKGFLGGNTSKLLPAQGLRYKSADSGMISMVQVSDPLAGEVIAINQGVIKRISSVRAFGQVIVTALWMFLMVSSVVFGIIWSIRYWRGKITGGANIRVRLWPLLASLFFITAFILTIVGSANPFKLLGMVSIVSLGIMLSTIFFALLSAWSAICIIKERRQSMNKLIYWHSAILSILHIIATSYLFWYGVIGIRTWA